LSTSRPEIPQLCNYKRATVSCRPVEKLVSHILFSRLIRAYALALGPGRLAALHYRPSSSSPSLCNIVLSRRVMSRYYDDRDRDRDGNRNRSRERRERSRERPHRSPPRDRDGGNAGREETTVISWIPAGSIDFDVINESINLFMGPKATVKPGKLANVRHTTPTL
jgi:hypothetical protein